MAATAPKPRKDRKDRKVTPLEHARLARGWSVRETAFRAKTDPAHLWRIEQGEAVPSLDLLARLADVLGLKELHRALTPYGGRSD